MSMGFEAQAAFSPPPVQTKSEYPQSVRLFIWEKIYIFMISLPMFLLVQVYGDGQTFYTLDEGNTKFNDLVQLVEFYQLNSGGLPTRLLHVCSSVQWGTSVLLVNILQSTIGCLCGVACNIDLGHIWVTYLQTLRNGFQ